MRYVLRWAPITAALIFLGILCTLLLGLWRFNRLVRRDVEELLALATTTRGIVKSCGFSGHAATFSSLPSTSSPLWNFAPALTNATR
jgi:hypothetical protein